MSTHDSHWTSDADLLDRYVLNQVDATQREQLEMHIRSCEECARRVQSERELVAGIRRHGRDVLKAQLKERLRKRKLQEIAWQQVVGVAAAVVLLVTVGIYNRWFFSPRNDKLPPIAEEQRQAQQTPQGQPANLQDKEGEAKAKSARSRTPAQKSPEVSRPSEGMRLEIDRAREPAAAPLGISSSAGAARDSADAKKVEKGDRLAKSLADKEEIVWAEGTVLSQQVAAGEPLRLMAAPAEKKLDALQGRRPDLKTTKQESAQGLAGVSQSVLTDESSEPALVVQRPLYALPARLKGQHRQTQTVPTMIEQTKNGLRVTLYLHPLWPDAELQNGRVQRMAQDSVILILRNQRIGYRLPAGWEGQGTKREK